MTFNSGVVRSTAESSLVTVPSGSNRIALCICKALNTISSSVSLGGQAMTRILADTTQSGGDFPTNVTTNAWILLDANFPTAGSQSLNSNQVGGSWSLTFFEDMPQSGYLRQVLSLAITSQTDPMVPAFTSAIEGDEVVWHAGGQVGRDLDLMTNGDLTIVSNSSDIDSAFQGTAPASPLNYSFTGHDDSSFDAMVNWVGVAFATGSVGSEWIRRAPRRVFPPA